MAAWNYVETGPAQAGAPGALQPEGPGEQDYVEFLPFQEASGNGPSAPIQRLRSPRG